MHCLRLIFMSVQLLMRRTSAPILTPAAMPEIK
jgi:hypothetical protein